ncbi:uncharacterized protein LOC106779503 [Vigna radiata var. radiata]|uniref:Uncharacterized protein LOC106779503 n=1 Tax=Vigna radiata var. radiata TaxID=3916 RepID=A0A1S3VXQ6_VIGRR|nr:uncharacterized protein LOC106779503 [Vigna radiata var. radiata]
MRESVDGYRVNVENRIKNSDRRRRQSQSLCVSALSLWVSWASLVCTVEARPVPLLFSSWLVCCYFWGPMASRKPSWRLRISMDSATILEMNTKLQDPHIQRLNMTPFNWCLNILNPIEVNIKLLKLMVKRWVENDVSFRVCQQLVPFTVVDVFMAIGLDIGGLDITFDECLVGLVGDMFNPKTMTKKDLIHMFHLIVRDEDIEVDVIFLDDLDSLCLYDWASGVHNNIVQNLNKCKKKIMSGQISKSLGLSGNVAVFQAWTVERLSLHGHRSQRLFPRIWRWLPYTGMEETIENIFKTGELNMEWYLSKNDLETLEVCAAFDMDEGGIGEETKGEGTKGEPSTLPEIDEDSSNDDTWEAGAEEIVRKTNSGIMSLNARIASLTKELMDLREFPIYNEEADLPHHEEGVVVGDEEPPAKHHKAAPSNKAAPSDHLPAYIHVDDGDNDDHEEHVPLRRFVGDPATDVDVEKLYITVSVKDGAHRVVYEIIGKSLNTKSMQTLAPRTYVDNMVVLFASTMFMNFQRRLTGVVKRVHFSSLYTGHIINDYRKMEKNQHVYTLRNYASYMGSDHFGLADIPTADFLFMAFCHDEHWWSYAVNLRTLQISVIDSLNKAVKDQTRIDTFVRQNMGKLFACCTIDPKGVLVLYLFKFDCGVIMLKAMEIWDEEDKYNGKSMPQ